MPRRFPKLTRAFYRRPAIEVAPDLIGKIIVRRMDDQEFRARIVETEAYIGQHDLACHASKGRTKRTEVMFGEAGHAYVYFIYGMHDMLNIVCAGVGDAQAVLVRAAEPLDEWEGNLSGPGRLARALKITRQHNGIDLTGNELFLLDPQMPPPRILQTKRIGVDYSGDWKDELLRFIDVDSRAVSGPRKLNVVPAK
jgi:DNA-3-methyladenine glycosylase